MPRQKKAPPPVVTKDQYDAATPAERRVMLAREVVSLLDAGFISAASRYDDPATYEVPLDKFLAAPKCEVCARGAIIVAMARVANECERRGWKRPSDLGWAAMDGNPPREAFPRKDLWDKVENAFEDRRFTDYSDESADDRLRAVCLNLIENDGALRLPLGAS